MCACAGARRYHRAGIEVVGADGVENDGRGSDETVQVFWIEVRDFDFCTCR